MKPKAILLGAALTASTFTAAAQPAGQESPRPQGQETVSFNPHWLMGIQAGAGQTLGEIGFGNMVSPAAAVYGGYQFTPLWGLRAGISGWQAKGAWVAPEQVYAYNYLQGNVDATLDLGNLCCGYSSKRLFSPYVFVGIGLNGAFHNGEAAAIHDAGHRMEYLWRDNQFSMAGRGGAGVNIRLCPNVYFNVEVNANILSDKFNSKKAGNADWQFNGMAGFTIKFGKTSRTTLTCSAPVPEPAAPAPQQAEPAEVQPAPAVPVKPAKATHSEDIFFTINSAVIRPGEEAKINALAEFMTAHPDSKVSVCGYADKETGTPTINLRLSKKRAEAVSKKLEEKGISPARISTDFKGDTVQPFGTPVQNRVSICIAE